MNDCVADSTPLKSRVTSPPFSIVGMISLFLIKILLPGRRSETGMEFSLFFSFLITDKGKYDLILNSEIKVPAGADILNYPIALYGGEDITQDVIAEINRKLAEEQKEKNKTP